MKTNVLGVQYDNVTMAEALDTARALLQRPEASYCVTPNAEMAYEALHDESFRAILNGASLVLPDGAGVVLGAKILKTPLKEKVAGIDFAANLLGVLEETGGRLYLLGGKPGIAEQAAENMKKTHPKLRHGGRLFQGRSSRHRAHQRGKSRRRVRLPRRAEAGVLHARPPRGAERPPDDRPRRQSGRLCRDGAPCAEVDDPPAAGVALSPAARAEPHRAHDAPAEIRVRRMAGARKEGVTHGQTDRF